MKLACITGIDGTGKSTLARGAVNALTDQGIEARYVYGRTYPVLSRLVMAIGRKLSLRGKNQWRDYTEYDRHKKNALKNRWLAAGYCLSILIDYSVQIAWKLLRVRRCSGVIVLDRYIYDTIISDIAVHLSCTEEETMQMIGRALRVLPRPKFTALLDVPAETAFSRKNDVPHVDYLRDRQRLYGALRSRPEVSVISGELPPRDVLTAFLAHLSSQELVGSKGY
jgi:dTMP kinase